MNAHPDLFPETVPPADPLLGLAVILPDACRCGHNVARIGPPRGPHLSALCCARCEQFRGWLAGTAHTFLTEIVQKFGRPDTPVAIRRGGQRP